MKIKQNWGSLAAIILGILSVFGGLTAAAKPPSSPTGLLSGLVMIIGALIYRSAKKRRELKRRSIVRIAAELVGLLAIIYISFGQKNILERMVDDPVPNLIIPVWAIVAYIYAMLRTIPDRSTVSSNSQDTEDS